ncbi:hypothetical protein [Campylobacter hyointestinalis]|uniref:hypothetical protein n=1 Tax=Campylobacter hyointestinalis TaxID=198 RepID=UPI000DCE87B8|nr:hypothetical protein [Campylobacter hyointestinalis]RAZ56496.1 hypothetical protein CHL10074_03135 [Campylobacter hyointestinalis subsp. lawsonii]RAZ64601.1 hypothetical protein CHL9767_03420 [Campylobacter hyointestinalis subsp. lawsonii]
MQNLNLKISKIYINLNLIKNIILNGSSTFSSVFMIVANAILLEISTENSVAILSVLMSVEFFASSFIMGMCGGISPLFSYHFAAKNMRTFKGLLKITFLSAALMIFGLVFLCEYFLEKIANKVLNLSINLHILIIILF